MPRILAKGSRAGVEDGHFDWNEEEDLKNYNIAFYDLTDLVNRRHEFLHPWFDEEDAIHLPSRLDVMQFLSGGHNLVIRLPEKNETQLRGRNRDGNQKDDDGNTIQYDCRLLDWLPFYTVLNGEDDGNGLVEVLDGFEDWEVCFSEGFEWQAIIEDVRQRGLYGDGTAYNDPRPRDPTPGEPMPKSRVPPSKFGPKASEERIAIENVNRTVASKVSIQRETEDGDEIESPGSVFLLPSHPEKGFDEFAQDILINVFDVDVEEKPVWVSDYSLPGESKVRGELEDLESRLSDLQEEIDKMMWFRQLLFANDEIDGYELEEPVREAFREVGFDVDGEKPGGRDGAVSLEDETIILEITGRRRGVRPHKIDKMSDHVENARSEGYCESCTGLLVYNAHRKKDPESRPLNTNNFMEKLEEYGYTFMTSLQVYQMLSLYKLDDINTKDIEAKLTGEELVVEFDGFPEKMEEEDVDSWLTALRSRIDDML